MTRRSRDTYSSTDDRSTAVIGAREGVDPASVADPTAVLKRAPQPASRGTNLRLVRLVPTSRQAAFPASSGTNLRLIRLFLASRQAPLTLAILVAVAALLQLVIHLHWIEGTGAPAQAAPELIEAAAAVAIAVTARSPFGELERTAGRALPRLRFGTTAALTALAAGLLMVGAATPGGDVEILRNLAGLTGIGLLTAAIVGGSLAWVGPTVYAVLAQIAIQSPWTTPWMWVARPPHDLGANLCAGLVFAAGLAVITIRGAHDSSRD